MVKRIIAVNTNSVLHGCVREGMEVKLCRLNWYL